MKKEAVILTRSSKIGGYCVAGVDIHTGEWVRFVSDDAKTHGALSRNDTVSYTHLTLPTILRV
mgnify:CR=1 FL=1